jgi:DNA-binding PadR family transcriptional regulator
MTTPATRSPDEFLPVKPVDLMVLMTLARGERHGYGIVSDIAEQTDGRIQLVPGNLYAVIRRLVADGLIEEARKRPAPDLDDRRRRYYVITGIGRRVVAAEARRLKGLIGLAESMDLI